MWRTTGFPMNFATVAELATIVGFLVIMSGGKQKRESGWRILGCLPGVVAGIQLLRDGDSGESLPMSTCGSVSACSTCC